MNKILTKAPAKLMIAGEYSVLFGGVAIVAAVDRFAKAWFRPGEHLRFFSQEYSPSLMQNDNPLWLALNKAAGSSKLIPKAGDYCLNTEVFFNNNAQKYGLGSSAAGLVSLCKLLLEQRGPYSKQELRDLAFKANQDFSKVGSGADIAASIESRAILYKKINNNYQIEPVNLEYFWENFIFVFTNRQQNTRDFVAQVLKLAKQDNKFMESFRANSDFFCSNLLNTKDNLIIVEIITKFYELLKNLGERFKIDIVSQEHQEIFHIAKEFNGSAKPSGAGGGDICLVFMPENKQEFIKKCQQRGFFSLELSLI